MTVTLGKTSYTVEATGREVAPYVLTGARGATYVLVRNVHSHKLYATRGIPARYVFTDTDGLLKGSLR